MSAQLSATTRVTQGWRVVEVEWSDKAVSQDRAGRKHTKNEVWQCEAVQAWSVVRVQVCVCVVWKIWKWHGRELLCSTPLSPPASLPVFIALKSCRAAPRNTALPMHGVMICLFYDIYYYSPHA